MIALLSFMVFVTILQTQVQACCDNPEYKKSCCPEECCHHGHTSLMCCADLYPFEGSKVFFSFDVTDEPWSEALSDHYSDGHRRIVKRIMREMDFLSPSLDSSTKVIELSQVKDGVQVKMVTKIAPMERQALVSADYLNTLKSDMSFGLLGSSVRVDRNSFQVHDIEMGMKKESKVKDVTETLVAPANPCFEQDCHYSHYKPLAICKGVLERFQIKLPQIEWKEAYLDEENEELASLKKDIEKELDTIQDGDSFVGYKVLAISQGDPEGIIVKIQSIEMPMFGVSSQDFINMHVPGFKKLLTTCKLHEYIGIYLCTFVKMIYFVQEGKRSLITMPEDEVKPVWREFCTSKSEYDSRETSGCCPNENYADKCCSHSCCDVHYPPHGGCCHKKFAGVKVFFSLTVTDTPWSEALEDHHSNGFHILKHRIEGELLFIMPNNVSSSKVIQFQKVAGGVLAKIVVKIPGIEEGSIRARTFVSSLTADILGGVLGIGVRVLSTFTVHEVEEGFKAVDTGANQESVLENPLICSGHAQRVMMRLTNQVWSTDLEDPNSSAYQLLAETFKSQYLAEYENSPVLADVFIMGFGDGGPGVFVKIQHNTLSLVEVEPEKYLINVAGVVNIFGKLCDDGTFGDFDVDSCSFVLARSGPYVKICIDRPIESQAMMDSFNCTVSYDHIVKTGYYSKKKINTCDYNPYFMDHRHIY